MSESTFENNPNPSLNTSIDAMPLLIYLDQNKWIDLSRALLFPDKFPQYVEVSKIVQDKTNKGEWILPISVAHFIETFKRIDADSKNRLIQVMGAMSKNKSIRPYADLEETEFLNAFRKIHGMDSIPISPISDNVFSAISLTLPDLTDHLPERFRKPFEDIILRRKELLPELTSVLNKEDVIIFAEECRNDDEQTKKELEKFQADILKMPREFRYNLYLLDCFTGLFRKHYQKLLSTLGKKKEDVFPPDILVSKDKTIALMESVPTHYVRTKLLFESIQNPDRPIGSHDGGDIVFLSTAIPYCDVVITERTWKHFSKQARLTEKYKCVVENDLSYLLKISD